VISTDRVGTPQSLKRKYHGHGRFFRLLPPAVAEVETAMKITGITVIVASFWTSASANAVPAAKAQVVICMTMTNTEHMGLQSQAKSVASAILASSSVKIQWHDPSQCPGEAIIVTLASDEPASLRPGLLAYALPFEGTHIVVFYDRVKNDRVKNRPGYASAVLGHVIAHEVTHILQGAIWHSETGIMKAQWSGGDFQQMNWKALPFTDEDIRRIQHGVKIWAATRASRGGVRVPVARQ
jgi:hypothetical protein